MSYVIILAYSYVYVNIWQAYVKYMSTSVDNLWITPPPVVLFRQVLRGAGACLCFFEGVKGEKRGFIPLYTEKNSFNG